jgi:hypothetical protein
MAKDAEQDWRAEAGRRFKEKQQKGRFKLAEGENTIRILCYEDKKGRRRVFFEYRVHREVGPNKRFVRCGTNVHGEGECWLCDEKIPALANSDDAGKQKRAELLAAKEQFVVQVATVDTDTGKMNGPFLWTVPTGGARSLAARLLGVLKSTKRDYVDPEEGYNLTIERTGMGKTDTNYSQPIPDEEPSKVPSRILAAVKPFGQLIPAYSEEQQKAAYFGRDEREEAEEAEEEETKPKRRAAAEDEDENGGEDEDRPRSKKKPRADDDEEAVAEEDDEAPRSKKKKPVAEDDEETTVEDEDEPASKRKKKRPVDEDEDAESEPEEDEEERPKPKKKARPADEDEEPVADEDEPAPKKKKKPVADEDEPEPEEEAEDEDEKPSKKKDKKHVEEEPDEEERPAKKKKPRPADDDE